MEPEHRHISHLYGVCPGNRKIPLRDKKNLMQQKLPLTVVLATSVLREEITDCAPGVDLWLLFKGAMEY